MGNAVGGGVGGLAVADAAQSMYEALDDAAKAEARRILLRMLDLDEALRPQWRSVPRAELETAQPARARALFALQTLGVVTRRDEAGGKDVVIGDASLLERWSDLAEWVTRHRPELLMRQQIAIAAEAWLERGRRDAVLWRGPQLVIARRFADGRSGDIELQSVLCSEFLAASLERDLAVGRRAPQRRRGILAVIGALLLVAGGLWLAGGDQAGGGSAQGAARSQALIADADVATDTPAIAEQLALAAYRYDPSQSATNLLYRLFSQPAYSTLANTGSEVLRVAAARDAPLVAASSEHSGFRIWSFADPTAPVLEATVRDAPAAGLAISPSGDLLAAGCQPKQLCLWSLANPKAPKVVGLLAGTSLTQSMAGVSSIAFSADGAWAAAAAQNGTTYLWSVMQPAQPRLVATLPNPDPRNDVLAAVAFSSRGDLLAETIQGGHTLLWSLTDAARPTQIATIETGYQSVAFSADGSMLAAAGDTQVGLWSLADPANPVPVRIENACATGSSGSVLDFRAIAFSPGGDQIAYSGEDTTDSQATLCILDLTATGLGHSAATATSIPTDVGSFSLAYSTTGALITGNDDGSIRLWRAPLQQIDGLALPDGHGDSFDVSVDGRLLAGIQAGGSDLQSELGVELWDLSSAAGPVLDAAIPVAAQNISFLTPKTLMTATATGLLQLWDVSDPDHPRQGATLGDALIPATSGWSFSGEVNSNTAGNTLAVLGSDDELHFWQVNSADEVQQLSAIPVPEAARGAVDAGMLPDGRTALVVTSAGVQWWDITDPTHPVPGSFSALPDANLGLLAGADNLAVAGAPPGRDGNVTVNVYAVNDGTISSSVPLATTANAGASVTDDGRVTAVTGDNGKTLTLWSTADPQQPQILATVLVPDPYANESVVFDQAGTSMAVWNSRSGSVQLWNVSDLRSPVLEETFTASQQAEDLSENLDVLGMEFGPTGMMFVQADETVFLVDPVSSGLASSLCADLGSTITPDQWQRYAPGIPYLDPCPSHAG